MLKTIILKDKEAIEVVSVDNNKARILLGLWVAS